MIQTLKSHYANVYIYIFAQEKGLIRDRDTEETIAHQSKTNGERKEDGMEIDLGIKTSESKPKKPVGKLCSNDYRPSPAFIILKRCA